MARMKVRTWTKPTAAAPADDVVAWGGDAAWPPGTAVKAVLLFTESCELEDVFQHGTGTGLGVRALGPGTGRYLIWAGTKDGGQYGGPMQQTVSTSGASIHTAIEQYPGPMNRSYGQVTMGTDQFTVRWDPNDAVPRVVHAVAFGDIADSFVTAFTMQAGAQEVTGLPWCPDLLVTLSFIGAGEPGLANSVNFGLGMANAAVEQFVAMTSEGEAGGYTATGRWFRSDAFAGLPDAGGQHATLTACTPTGFTYTGSFAGPMTAAFVVVLCLKGIASQIGVTTKPTGSAPASHPIALTGMTRAAGIVLAGVGEVSGGPYPHGRLCVGAWDGTAHAACTHTSQDHHRSTASDFYGYVRVGNPHAISRDNACYIRVNSDGTRDVVPGTLDEIDLPPAGEDALAHGVSLAPSAVTLSWNPNDGDPIAIGYCVLGSGTHGVCEPVIEPPLGPIAGCGATFGPEPCAPACPPDPPGLTPEAVEVRAAFRAALFLLGIGTAPVPGALAAITGCGATFANDPCGGLVRPVVPESCEAPLGAFELGASCLGELPTSPSPVAFRSRRHAR